MTHFLRDILRQPEELRRTSEHLTGPTGAGRGALEATTAIQGLRVGGGIDDETEA